MKYSKSLKIIGFYLCLTLPFAVFAQKLSNELWLSNSRAAAEFNVWKNISPSDAAPGAVIASPSRENPNYYFHWVRDAALTMLEIVEMLYAEPFHPETQKRYRALWDYLNFSKLNQMNSGFDQLGEPKYEVDGRPYVGPWGRPQNDGPALRALCISRFARWVVQYENEGLNKVESFILPVLLMDLEYLEKYWRQTSFDLWEEVCGQHFYTRSVQIAGLEHSAELFRLLNMSDKAEQYQKLANDIAATLWRHVDAKSGRILETLDRSEGIDYKNSNLDSATVLAVLHAGDFSKFEDDSEAIFKTIQSLENQFARIYKINHIYDQFPPVTGRYPEDLYYGGNPWFITTLAMAEWNYKISTKVSNDKNYKLNNSMVGYLRKNGLKFRKLDLSVNEKNQISKFFLLRGDQYMERIRLHQGENYRMDEQMDRETGFMKSAYDLTWNYVAFLSAARAADKARGSVHD